MVRKIKSPIKSNVSRLDDVPTPVLPDTGIRLEQLCEEREVGMDGISHWRDAAFDVADIYNLLGWFEFDGYLSDLTSRVPDSKKIKALPQGKFEPLQHLFSTIKAEEVYLAPGTINHSTGVFRYEVPGDARSVIDLNLTFDDINEIGFSTRSMLF